MDQLLEKEYIITNGLGGFSSASLAGANTRKYHSILNASLNPPVNRTILLSRVMSTITLNGIPHLLESTVHEKSHTDNTIYTKGFSDLPIPTFHYAVEDCDITKQICMKYGENTSLVKYTITTSSVPVELDVALHVNARDHHDLSTEGSFKYSVDVTGTSLKLSSDLTTFYISGFGNYSFINQWAKPEFYLIEKRRGQEDVDTNYIVGSYHVEVPAHTTQTFYVIASTESKTESGDIIFENELKRRDALYAGNDLISKRLHIGCDHFIVHRQSTQSKTVIAGYPWFTDWGRDTMIALPGLTLTTNRFDDAKDIIQTFVKYEKDGLIPNMFPDDNIEPMYNTIDGTLWLFIAIYEYINRTNDIAFLKAFIQH